MRAIESLETQGDRPLKPCIVTNCGELSPSDRSAWHGPAIPSLEVCCIRMPSQCHSHDGMLSRWLLLKKAAQLVVSI